MTTLVIASEHEKRIGIIDLVCVEVEKVFAGEITPIYIIAQEEVVGSVGAATNFKQFEGIVQLSVSVSADCQNPTPI